MPHNSYALKQVYTFLFIFSSPVLLFAQQTDSVIPKKDPSKNRELYLVEKADSVIIKSDSNNLKDTIISRAEIYNNTLHNILKENRFLNSSGKPVAMTSKIKKRNPQDSLFYLLTN
ncbi:MAG: hypothetical protein ABI760_22805 [Ferruginibacter sp.]